jgi:heme exporter protein D
MGGIDNATWQALGLVLTVIGLGVSALVWRRRGAADGLRGVAWALLPLAAALTGTLRLLWEIGDSVASWAVRLVFSPVVWLGIVLAGVSLVLFVVSGVLRGRAPKRSRSERRAERRAQLPAHAGGPRAAAGPDDDLADIEAILRKHGIS